MDAGDVIDKIKDLLSSKAILIIIASILVLAVIYLGYMSWKAPSAEAMNILQTQNMILKKNLDEVMKVSNAKIKELQSKLNKSQKTVKELDAKLKKVREQYAKIEPPKSPKELVDRYNALGYTIKSK